ncbi:MAG: TonB C-terminal domain-containing protein [Campylobacterota bacterium]|nr:TonB C-terminal domain-containing protein [Campylobacterota bacterium]
MDNKRVFFISCLLSISIYATIIFTFLFYLQNSDVKKFDSIAKNTILQLDIIVDSPKKVFNKVDIQSKIKNNKSKKVIKKSKSTSAKRKTNLKSLFANVKTKSTNIVKKRVTNIKQSSIASRYKSKFEKIKKTKNLSLNNLNKNKHKNFKNIVSNESKNKSDPYYSKIYELISARWQPTIFFSNTKAKVIITISNNGDFKYKFIQYSDNISFDKQLKGFLDNQLNIKYPINPNNRTTNIEIIFQSKG